jgi:hypothetical protein
MLPTVAALTPPFVGLNDDSRFCAELFLRMPGRDDSVIGGSAWKMAVCRQLVNE